MVLILVILLILIAIGGLPRFDLHDLGGVPSTVVIILVVILVVLLLTGRL